MKRIKSYCLIYSDSLKVFWSSFQRRPIFACMYYAASSIPEWRLATPSFRSTPYSHYYPKCIRSVRICGSRAPPNIPFDQVNGVDRNWTARHRGDRFFGRDKRSCAQFLCILSLSLSLSGNHSFLPLSVMASWSLKPALPTRMRSTRYTCWWGGETPSGPSNFE